VYIFYQRFSNLTYLTPIASDLVNVYLSTPDGFLEKDHLLSTPNSDTEDFPIVSHVVGY